VTVRLPQEAEVLEAEWALLVECAKPQPDPHRLAERLRAPIQWLSLIAFAEDHSVLGLTAARLANYDENAVSPGEFARVAACLYALHDESDSGDVPAV
jgi:hypothetical protein